MNIYRNFFLLLSHLKTLICIIGKSGKITVNLSETSWLVLLEIGVLNYKQIFILLAAAAVSVGLPILLFL